MTRTGHAEGMIAESLAALALMLKGYRVLARRYRTKLGEIDLIARRGRVIVFVEVKRRKSARDALEAIHAENRARVTRAAALYLQKHPEYAHMDIRFDAVIVTPKAWPRHVVQAWEEAA